MKRQKNEVLDMLILILQIGITMLVPIFMCTLAGAWFGARFHMKWIAVVAFFLGAAAGFRNVYRLVKKYLREES